MHNIKPPSALNTAIHLLARREHSAKELFQKLLKKGFNRDEAESALITCQERNYQSDLRFCEQFCRLRMQQGYGPIRIEQELQARGIAAHLIEPILYDAGVDWEDLVLRIIQKKTRGKPASTPQERLKIKQYLYYRGFPADLIRLGTV